MQFRGFYFSIKMLKASSTSPCPFDSKQTKTFKPLPSIPFETPTPGPPLLSQEVIYHSSSRCKGVLFLVISLRLGFGALA